MNEAKTINVVWAVEFGGSAVRRFRLTRTDEGYRADRYAEAPCSARWTAGADSSVAAGELPHEEISEPLAACLGNDLVLYRTIPLPPADDATLEKMIHSRLETLLPTQVEKFAAAWMVLDRPTNDLRRVLLCAVRRESLTVVTDLTRRWRSGGADVTTALPALVGAWGELYDENDPVLLMDIGARSTALGIVRDKTLRCCAVVDAGGDAWTEQLARTMNLTREEAEHQKLRQAQQNDPAVRKCLDEVLSAWAKEVREAYNDCLAETTPETRPTRCVLFGRSARLPGAAACVSRTLGIDAEVAPTPDSLHLDEGVQFDAVAPAVGAAIQAMRNPETMIRLARREEDQPAARSYKRRYWVAVIAWLIASVAGLYVLDLHEAAGREKMVATVYRETYHQGGLVKQLAVGDYLESGAPVPLDVIEKITRVAPESIILSSLSYARGGEVSLQGTLGNEKECQEFLEKLTDLGRVDLRRARPDNNRFRFELILTLKRAFTPTSQPASKPASQPAESKPAGVPSKSAESKPASLPTSSPASQPNTPPTTQSATQPTGGAR
ncbi:MAG: pilus assembly protein PilM [Phycisphaerae bacterium]|nr:pilus assembly protein PilM [Phycisphaerae bacterium]